MFYVIMVIKSSKTKWQITTIIIEMMVIRMKYSLLIISFEVAVIHQLPVSQFIFVQTICCQNSENSFVLGNDYLLGIMCCHNYPVCYVIVCHNQDVILRHGVHWYSEDAILHCGDHWYNQDAILHRGDHWYNEDVIIRRGDHWYNQDVILRRGDHW